MTGKFSHNFSFRLKLTATERGKQIFDENHVASKLSKDFLFVGRLQVYETFMEGYTREDCIFQYS